MYRKQDIPHTVHMYTIATFRGFPVELGNIRMFPSSTGKPRKVAIVYMCTVCGISCFLYIYLAPVPDDLVSVDCTSYF